MEAAHCCPSDLQEVLTAAMEAGLSPLTVLFDEGDPKAASWRSLGRFRPVTARSGGELVDPADGRQIGVLQTLSGPDDLRAAESAAGRHQGTYVMDATDWQASLHTFKKKCRGSVQFCR